MESPTVEGWYMTRLPEETVEVRRWWNGKVFSLPVYPDDTPKRVEVRAAAPSALSDRLLWREL
jgi:hypothetical protein